MVSVLEALVDRKRKKSDNRVFHLQDLYQPSIGQRKPAKAPGLGKPSHHGPESMTANPRCRNPGGLCPYSPNRRLVAGEIRKVPINKILVTTTKYMCYHTMARLYFVLLSCGVWLKEPQIRSRLANRGCGLFLHIRGLFANSEEPSVFTYKRTVHRPRFRLASRTLGRRPARSAWLRLACVLISLIHDSICRETPAGC